MDDNIGKENEGIHGGLGGEEVQGSVKGRWR